MKHASDCIREPGTPRASARRLGRYTHRVAIANSRLVALDGSEVRVRWRDYRQHNQTKVMALDAKELIRHFRAPRPPDRFHRIRHDGYLANSHRAAKLALIRRLLAWPVPSKARVRGDYRAQLRGLLGIDLDTCPCSSGTMRVAAILPRTPPSPPVPCHRPFCGAQHRP